MKRDPSETRATILGSALKEISRKGYPDATIRQIAQNAKVTALTVFRHFSDKEHLFSAMVVEFSRIRINEDEIASRLSYTDVQSDLDTLSREYFRIIFANLDILRVFINEGYNNPMVQKHAWYISPVLQQHFKTYLERTGLGKNNRDEIAEMFIAHITRRVLEYNTHDSIWDYTDEVAEDFNHKVKSQLLWLEQTL
ncbi:MAG: hypothetical protein CVU86_01545 [Firmicutes bacterium HGW-Firmicutes-11]|jgi:AcrR family transcriptional regulator|nr:MAG: hypothetical protein CVU86_01545 [Firmicutes bacterium HGW-Firmicutes-11]